jgi:isoamylase
MQESALLEPDQAVSCGSAHGKSAPLGATVTSGGVNFSVYSRDATRIDLLFFDHEDDGHPSRVIQLDPATNRTYHYWHIFIPGIRPGQIYAYRAHGPFHPGRGMRFDADKVLLDPYGRAVAVPKNYSREGVQQTGDNATFAMKSVVADMSLYDWEGDAPLGRPCSQTIIYEMHVKGFTRHPNSGVSERGRGRYLGVIEKIPYLQDLGISAVEFLPVFQFDSQDAPNGKTNYWGYAPVSFFAPHQEFASGEDVLSSVNEFRDLVKSLHRAGIEVILDVVFNHTAEGNHLGPTLCFRGLANKAYYILEQDGACYANYTGTGNTLNANHPIVRRMIVDSLRYWVEEMHVDGFRFDLASVLARDSTGAVMSNPPVLWDIESDPVLAGTKIIAEAWDAAGLYQVGGFIGDSWKEWNGRFRDDVRSFFRGDNGSLRAFADRLVGSHELYGHEQREAEQSVNFVTCHDGFTLNDLVSYDHKHNEANGEEGRDGTNDNRSWNCGTEGPTADRAIESLRNRQVKNFLTTILLSLGVPMFAMGDEVRRTQHGNNNPYCQDNEISWFDWSLLEGRKDVYRFVKLLISRRLLRGPGRRKVTLTELVSKGIKGWHGMKLNQPDWSDWSHSIALLAELPGQHLEVYFIFNAYWHALEFELPRTEKRHPWKRWIDTALESPDDIVEWQFAPEVSGYKYLVGARSVVVLETCATRETREV